MWLDSWPQPHAEIPLSPLQAVTSITLHTSDGGTTVLDPADYQVASGEPARVMLKSGAPRALRALAFTGGYGDASDVPALVREAILHIVAGLYVHRGDTDIPPDALAMLQPYRILKL